ncbi:helix-turn-helix domain-containing protein [Streptomonospora salina]
MLTLAEREEITLAYARGEGVRAIARLMGLAGSEGLGDVAASR